LLGKLFEDIISYDQIEIKRLLIVEGDELEASQIAKIHRDEQLQVTVSNTGKKGIELVNTEQFDCIIVGHNIPDMTRIELIDKLNAAKAKVTPVIIHSAKDLGKQELNKLDVNSSFFILNGTHSIEHLLDETIAHVHINHKNLSPEKRKIIENIRKKDDILIGKNILVVDDDVRNLFTLTTVFERYNINVVTAEGGMEAIHLLNENPKIEMVLMDIMMPEMDGYETTRKIRRDHQNSTLPIIAVTAKAMRGDREKCIEAGASDYIIKPVKIDQLLSLMRLWFL
jgi:CheY-like chemotaxis protein